MIDEDHRLDIRTLDSASELQAIVTVFSQVWGSATPLVGVELLRAVSHSGGYVAGAFDTAGNVLAASFGFLARHRGAPALHSHVTGVLPGVQHTGIGRSMKYHQRHWAAEQGLDWVTWTFDPLVRRNAWFNIEVLHAEVAEYLVDFYGPMTDSVNRRDETDRLVMAWSTAEDRSVRPATAGVIVEVPTPEDIVVLRRTDPAAAHEWRLRVREELGRRLDAGWAVVGVTRDGSYTVQQGA
jgi:predicted GNAT superfamily acetyltransferase